MDMLNRLRNRGFLDRTDFPKEFALRTKLQEWGQDPRRMIWFPPFFQRRLRRAVGIPRSFWSTTDHMLFGNIALGLREGRVDDKHSRYVSVEHCKPDGSGSVRLAVLLRQADAECLQAYLASEKDEEAA